MTPNQLAELHAQCFTTPRPFTETEFTDFLRAPSTLLIIRSRGFAMGRVIADEAELLTLAVDPEHRRCGTGRALLSGFETAAATRDAAAIFLEVAADNQSALTLYLAAGYTESGRRRGYYTGPDHIHTDAILMKKQLDTA